jgi:hypothetical protein
VQANLFRDAINETSPARAVQAFQSALVRIAYYDHAAFFSDNRSITTIDFLNISVPTRRIGFWVVIACIALQLGLFVLITFTFSRTRYSLPRNAWHAVAQITESAEAQGVLRTARTATDTEVAEHIGKSSQRYQVDRAVFTATTSESKLGTWIGSGKLPSR